MALHQNSNYCPPPWLPGGHFQTIYPALFRQVSPFAAINERLELADGDFLDLAWSGKTSGRLAILSHGLEADMKTGYILGMAATLIHGGWDVLTWNFRGCGREPNRLLRMYHSGATEDLAEVLSHALLNHPAQAVDLVGFSLGGNLTLKYLGECPNELSHRLHRAVVFSVPCDLACSSRQLARFSNRLYMERFLVGMRAKLRAKEMMFPGCIDTKGIDRIRTFQEFDDRFTAPLHGFRDAEDYWTRNSSRQFIPKINLPTLLISARNDPFLGPDCYPWHEAKTNGNFQFESPNAGGHVGFPSRGNQGRYWSEIRTVDFLSATH